jgi:hypothetical protein
VRQTVIDAVEPLLADRAIDGDAPQHARLAGEPVAVG